MLVSVYSIRTASLDAIPDISDPQIVVYVKWPRSPQLLEREVTEPLISALVGSPDIQALRGSSHMGYSFIYVILSNTARRDTVQQLVLDRINAIRPAAAARRQRDARAQCQQHGLDLPVRARRPTGRARPARPAPGERKPDQARAADRSRHRGSRVGRRAGEAVSDQDLSAAAGASRDSAQAGDRGRPGRLSGGRRAHDRGDQPRLSAARRRQHRGYRQAGLSWWSAVVRTERRSP